MAVAAPFSTGSALAADPQFPFSAVLGQEDLRLALILNAVHPAVGGVLARGEKGTAKSTLVRALAAVLPWVGAVTGCRFACDPTASDPACPDGPHPPDAQADVRRARLVELPVGASEDRLTGSLDLERALGHGVAAYQPGLLAAAHRGMLYVDEVNLLPDHLVDVLLDAAAMGVAHVERDGVSVRHAARFILVGTMNPEEGELRPQLLDRFGLTVEVAASRDPRDRAEVVRRRLAYEADPAGFAATWAAADRELGERIAAARAALGAVVLPNAELERIARVCAAFEVDGMRADLVTARAAIALAAWRGLSAVTAAEVREAARLALPHRRRRNPFDAPGLDQDKLDEALADAPDDGPEPDGPGHGRGPSESDGADAGGGDEASAPEPAGAPPAMTSGAARELDGQGDARNDVGRDDTHAEASVPEPGEIRPDNRPMKLGGAGNGAGVGAGREEQAAVAASEPYRTKLYVVPGVGEGVPGRRSAGRATGRGRTVGAEKPDCATGSVHLPATLRAAAARQLERGRVAGGPLLFDVSDLRAPVRRDREGNLVLFVVDASGSMAARARMAAVKGAVLSLLLDAYQRRDKVGLVTFRGASAEVALPPTGSVEAAAARLASLPTGGRTPLAAGLTTAADVVRRERLRDPRRRPLLIVVTDGRATASGLNVGARIHGGGSNVGARVHSGGGSSDANNRPTGAVAGRVAAGHTAAGRAAPGPAAIGWALAEVWRVAAYIASTGTASIVVDCEAGPVRLGLAASLAAALGGEHVPMADLAVDSLASTVRATTGPQAHRLSHWPAPQHPTTRKAA
ncbi:MAG TPA: VWA domain-containing protein [Actinocrinis sp.]|uniref:VWA domain-containing protein n=1 Tax=Actinocrinis sp. TaxID=1920516 RepID=UPI002DDD8906|nr:VWA domain-containing protein [Actinocrinis sp.]HEV3170032.1 VWA domain-containing protein [Actinocrinis sp.]